MSKYSGDRKEHDRDPSRSRYETPQARRILADLFVKKWLQPGRRSVDIQWIKVVAEWVMGSEVYGDGAYAWITQADVEAALSAAGYRLRRSKTDPGVYVACSLRGDLAQQRFFRRGGHWPGSSRSER